MKRGSLFGQTFISMVAISLAAVLATGYVARRALDSAFEAYLISAGVHMGPGGGVGRQTMLGSAEQAFLAGVDRGIVVSALIAVVLAAVAAWLLARYLLGPVRRLTSASQALAAGDLSHRVERRGPEEVAELADAYNDMADALERAEGLRQRLVADVAHELRNPIGALRAQIEGIADGVLQADDDRLASLVDDTAVLSRLVDDLQELSVAEAGRLHYERVRFDMCSLISAERDRARRIAPSGVTVDAQCPDRAVWVEGDEFRIAQVVRNLLTNSVRHTAAGRIDVRVLPDADRVRVEVSDTGEGIAPEDLPFIWERFYRADVARASSTGGSGLGLAIARRIVADHGGTVFASSTEGAGSTIGFEVPATGET